MVAFLARTGRESQRYSITGQRLVVGSVLSVSLIWVLFIEVFCIG